MQSLPQFAVDRLQVERPVGESHPDDDLLTAFAERSLQGAERVFVMEHLAHCRSCRDVVAIVSSSTESVTDGEVARRFGSDRQKAWYAWPALRWGALAAGVLIVATAGFLEFGHQVRTDGASNLLRNEVVQNSLEGAQSVASLAALPHETQANSGSEALLSAPQVVKPRTRPSGARKQMRRDEASIAIGQLASNEIPVLPGRESADLEIVKAKNAIPAELDASSEEAASAWMPAQVGLPRWAVNAEGRLLRSFDGGNSWENVNPVEVAGGRGDTMNFPATGTNTPARVSKEKSEDGDSSPRFLALAVDGLEVWVSGSGGRLYHSSDSGDHWDRVIPAEAGSVFTGDIIGIQFYDAEHGRVTTSSSETWGTSDAGQTWLRQQ